MNRNLVIQFKNAENEAAIPCSIDIAVVLFRYIDANSPYLLYTESNTLLVWSLK
jgi:hypothetical protein